MIPLYGFLEGDTLGILVFAYAEDTVAELAARLERAAAVRVDAKPGTPVVVHRGRVLKRSLTLADVGIEALDRIDVRAEETGRV